MLATLQNTMTPRQALAAARYWAVAKTPYFAQVLLSLVPREVADGTLSKTGTFAVTPDLIMLYEPSALLRWTTPEAGAVMIHEVMHVLRDHAGRRGDADATLWNLAGDCEINDDLIAMSLPLPDGGGMQPQTFNLPIGKTAEEYYAALKQQDDAARKQRSAQSDGGAGEGESESDGGDADESSGGQSASGSQAPSEKHAEHRCGGCAGNAHKAEPEGDAKGRSVGDLEVIKQATAVAVKDHAQRHGIGSVPAGMARWAEQRTTAPKVPWQQRLASLGRARVAFRAGAADYSFSRISRRQGGLGFGLGKPVVPAMVARTPEVAIAVDTSGSMGTSEVERAVVEATSIMRTVGASVHLIACDCRVHTTRKVSNPKQLLEGLRGGGGTDFRPVFDEMAKVRPRPDVLIFITDGGGWAPELPPPGIKVIWLLVGSHKMKPLRPTNGAYQSIEWGDMIEVDE